MLMQDSFVKRWLRCYRNVWKFLQKVAKDAYNITDYISRNLETTVQLLKKCPDKWSVVAFVVAGVRK